MIGYVFKVRSREHVELGESDLTIDYNGKPNPEGDGNRIILDAPISRNALMLFFIQHDIYNDWSFNGTSAHYVVDMETKAVLFLTNIEFMNYTRTHSVEPLINLLQQYQNSPCASIF